jgi:hypothetical protein
VRADQKLTAFLELELLRKAGEIFRNSPDMKTSIPPVLITFVIACFALLPQAHGVLPPPDGGYPGGNTAEGNNALLNLSVGTYNTAVGLSALYSLESGDFNTAVGLNALHDNIRGDQNTAVGADALYFNIGRENTAVGRKALFKNTGGRSNSAVGFQALADNVSGSSNTAGGDAALAHNIYGTGNTAIGRDALHNNKSGDRNIALGYLAGQNLTVGNDTIYIGNEGGAGERNTTRIGNQNQSRTFIAGISGAPVTGTAVVVDGSGQLGVAPSSARFKEAIKSMDNASEALFSLKPVTFRYKKEIDPQGISQLGLVAEEVEKVNRDSVVRDKDGKPFTVRYDQVNAMLLNEFLKEHSKVEQQRKDFEAARAQQQKQIDALTAGLTKVSAQLELSKSAPHTVLNNR